MPELPEVETTRRGIEKHVINKQIFDVILRTKKLRWPIPARLKTNLKDQSISAVNRRGKYLLLTTGKGTLIIHLGMSGSLRVTDKTSPAKKHDHVDIVFSDKLLRLHDPRRFGAVLWTSNNPFQHKLLSSLGPEPLSQEFNGSYLYNHSRKRKISVKEFIMNSRIVVGIGNIYATEALYSSGINPLRAAGKISNTRYELLADNIKTVLTKALQCGGTTLRDFVNEEGKPGYFSIDLKAYGREGLPCMLCNNPLRAVKQNQRTTTYCTHCQK